MKTRVTILRSSTGRFMLLLPILLVLSGTGLTGQETRLMSGILRDETGIPIPGVNIVIKGTATGTVTDVNGYYAIEAPVGSTLVISFVGYLSEEVVVAPPEKKETRKKQDSPKDTALTQVNSEILQAEQPPKIFRHTIPNNPGKTLSPYFFIESDQPETDRMPLKSTSAEVNIAGVIADVKVTQVYINEGKNTLEAIYIFPGSVRSAVYAMNMRIGERILKAKIRERNQARAEYETAKAQGKTATLLEQNRPNVFQMNVANILPGDTIVVELSYTELLESLDGIYEFVYPTVVGPRYSETPDTKENASEQWVSNPYLHEGESPDYLFNIRVNVNAGIPIQQIYCPSHEIKSMFTGQNRARVMLSESEIYGGNRDFILRYGLRGGKVESGILIHENGDENFFLLMMEPPKAPSLEDIPPREYIFVVDVSGSMHGFPLEVSKSVMKELLDKLGPRDRFNILTFAAGNAMMWNESRPATKANIVLGTGFMNMQSGGGGTRLLDALDRALKVERQEGYSRIFVVLTDGYVDFEKEAFIRVRKNLNKANLFALGIGSSCNRYLIDGLAHAGMGEPFVATTSEEGKKAGKKLIEYIEKPVLTNISVDFGDFQAYDFEPASIPDVFAKRSIILFGKYRGNSQGKITVRGYSGANEYTKAFNLEDATSENNQALRYLWARNRVRYLDDFAQYYTNSQYRGYDNAGNTPNTPDRVSEITRLGLKYNILTQYTSFIAVDSIIRRTEGKISTIKQPLPLPTGVSDYAVGDHKSMRNANASSTTSADLSISMMPSVESLDEVLVIGYGTQRRTDVTGTVSSVTSSELLNSLNLQQALQGRVSGLQVVNNDGSPGGGVTVRIRGNSSLMGSQDPLVVINGVTVSGLENPETSPLASINPADIESVQVLKDASSTAIFGSRAANGVIYITTKNGRAGKRQLSVETGFGISSKSASTGTDSRNPVWYDNLLRTGTMEYVNLGAQKGTHKHSYLVSLRYDHEKGILIGSGMRRYTGNANFSHSLFHKFLDINAYVLSGYATVHDFLVDTPVTSEFTPAAVERSIYNVYGKTDANLRLPLEGLQFKNSFSGSLVNRHASYVNNLLPVSFVSFMNDNLRSGSMAVNTGFTYEKYFNNTWIRATAFYESAWYDQKYNSNGLAENEELFGYPADPFVNSYPVSSFLARLNFSQNDKYIFTATTRRDASQRFKTGNKQIVLPSFACAWRIGNEPFLSRLYWLSDLKLRFSWGYTGNSRLPYYPASMLISVTGDHSIIPVLGENPELMWEKTRQTGLGVDLSALNSRINLTLDLFSHETSNMYYLTPVEHTEQVCIWSNAGDFTNKGLDIDLQACILNSGDYTLKASLNFALNRTKITRLTDGKGLNPERESVQGIIAGQQFRTGDPLGVYYGYSIDHIDYEDHMIYYADMNNDGTVNGSDKTALAFTSPKWYGGATLSGAYKNVECTAVLRYTYGNNVLHYNEVVRKVYDYHDNISGSREPVLNNLYVEPGSFLKLSRVSLKYTFFKNTFKVAGPEAMSVTLTAGNLFTLSRYSGQDPEFNNWTYREREVSALLPGVDREYYPVSRTYLISLEIKF